MGKSSRISTSWGIKSLFYFFVTFAISWQFLCVFLFCLGVFWRGVAYICSSCALFLVFLVNSLCFVLYLYLFIDLIHGFCLFCVSFLPVPLSDLLPCVRLIPWLFELFMPTNTELNQICLDLADLSTFLLHVSWQIQTLQNGFTIKWSQRSSYQVELPSWLWTDWFFFIFCLQGRPIISHGGDEGFLRDKKPLTRMTRTE